MRAAVVVVAVALVAGAIVQPGHNRVETTNHGRPNRIVAVARDGRVVELDGNGKQIRQLRVTKPALGPEPAAVLPNGDVLYHYLGSNEVLRADGAVVARVAPGLQALAALSPDGRSLALFGMPRHGAGVRSFTVVEIATGRARRLRSFFPYVIAFTWTASGHLLLLGNPSLFTGPYERMPNFEEQEIDPVSGQVVRTRSTPFNWAKGDAPRLLLPDGSIVGSRPLLRRDPRDPTSPGKHEDRYSLVGLNGSRKTLIDIPFVMSTHMTVDATGRHILFFQEDGLHWLDLDGSTGFISHDLYLSAHW